MTGVWNGTTRVGNWNKDTAMSIQDYIDMADTLGLLVYTAEKIDMTRDELLEEIKFMRRSFKRKADMLDMEMSKQLDRMYQDDPVIPV